MAFVFFLSAWFLSFQAHGKEKYHYFSSPAYVHSYEDLDAKIWVLINRIPELEWKSIQIPPARNKVTLLPQVILVSGKFQKAGLGKRRLFVNGSRVRVSEQGEFVLRVLTQGSEFGLQILLRDLGQKEDLKQTIGMRIFSTKKERREVAASTQRMDFAGTFVFSQRRVASVPPQSASDALSANLEELSKKRDPFNHFEVSLGASLGSYEQDNFYRQSPKNSYIRVNFERNLEPFWGLPFVAGLDGRFSLIGFNSEAAGTLQFINPELKLGLVLMKSSQADWMVFTGTNYFSSFGNDFLGASSLWGQSLSTRFRWDWSPSWGLDLYGRLLYLPQAAGLGFLSSREFLAGFSLKRNTQGALNWGVFTEFAQSQIKLNQSVESSFFRLGIFTSF